MVSKVNAINLNEISGKKILISGGLGFVGVNLVSSLLSNGIKPVVLDYFPEGFKIDERFLPFNLDELDFVNVNINNRKKLVEKIKTINPDYLVHLAAMTNLTKDFDHAHQSVNVNIIGTLNLLEAIHNSSIKSFVFLSSSDVYGEVDPPFNENQRILPASPYSVSKAAAEMYGLMFNRVHNIPITILRSFNVFGKYQKANRVIPFIITNLLKNEKVKLTLGEQKREFNYVDNLIDAIFLSLTTQDSIGKILNVGNGESITIKEIALKIGKKLSKENLLNFGAIPYRKNEIWDMFCDNKLAKDVLNWKPRISIDKGLNQTINWFKEHY